MKEQYEEFVKGNKLLPVFSLLLEATNTKTIFMLKTDITAQILISINKEAIEEALTVSILGPKCWPEEVIPCGTSY